MDSLTGKPGSQGEGIASVKSSCWRDYHKDNLSVTDVRWHATSQCLDKTSIILVRERRREGGTGGGQKRVMYCIHTSLCLYLFVVRWLSVGMTYWGKSRVHDDLQHTWKLRFESFKNVEAKTCLSGLKFAQHVTHRPLNTHAGYTDKRFVYTLNVDYSDYTRLYTATTHYTASGGG